MAKRLLSMKQVLERIPLSRTEIYRRIKAGTFPPQIRLGPNRIAFVESEIDRWIENHDAGSSRPNGDAVHEPRS